MQQELKQQRVAIYTSSPELFRRIAQAIPTDLAGADMFDRPEQNPKDGTVLAFVDHGLPTFEPLLQKLSTAVLHTVLVVDERKVSDTIPSLLTSGAVDDLLLLPLRPIEIMSKIRHAMHLSQIKEVAIANKDLHVLIEKFEDDLRAARAIQRSLIPEKFPEVHGMKVMHKYLSGFKSGGDYIDFFEFEDKTHVGLLMSDSTGYGLSSAFMSVILRLAVKLSRDEARSPASTVSRIFEELSVTMKPTENLSIFYAVINRKTFEMKYTSAGTMRFVHQVHGEAKVAGTSAGEATKTIQFHDRSLPDVPALKKEERRQLADHSVVLNPNDRLTVFSDGFGENFGDAADLESVFKRTYGDDPIELINEFNFRVKNKLETEDDMPPQDCSVIVIDIEKRAMRLAPK